jgi:hypothetical protein
MFVHGDETNGEKGYYITQGPDGRFYKVDAPPPANENQSAQQQNSEQPAPKSANAEQPTVPSDSSPPQTEPYSETGARRRIKVDPNFNVYVHRHVANNEEGY